MLYLLAPSDAKVFRLSKDGKEEVPEVQLPRVVPYKNGPHMVNFISYFNVEASELNHDYYDGGAQVYDLLTDCLRGEYANLGLEFPDFETALKKLGAMGKHRADATVLLKSEDGGLFRFTFRAAMGMCDVYQFWTPFLMDEKRFVNHGELMDVLDRKHAEAQERLKQLFDPTNTQVGVDTFADYFKPL